MKETKRIWPSVPGGSLVPSQVGDWIKQRSEGAKNHRVGPGHQGRRKLYIATYNNKNAFARPENP